MLLRPMTVEDDDFEPPTMRPAHGRAPLHESARLEQWVRERLRTQALAVASPATPETRAPRTLSASELAGHWGVQASGSLPFKSARSPSTEPGATQSEQLERWLRAELREQATAAPYVTWSQPAPMRLTAEVSAPVPVPQPLALKVHGFEPLALGEYAAIKVANWNGRESLDIVLERHGIDEIRWRENEAWLRDALAASARERDAGLALGVAAAIRGARLAAKPVAEATEPELESYAKLRAALERAGEDGEDEVLLVEGIPRHEWDELRVDWSERLRSDPDLARKVRKAVGRARRTLEASLLAAESP